MRRHAPRVLVTGLGLALTLVAGAAASLQDVSRRDADRLQQKIDVIAERGLVPRQTAFRTIVTEAEINSYLAIYGRSQLPAGVVDPQLTILGSDRISGRATIDLDAVRRGSSGGWLDPASYLSGHLPVTAQGVLRTKDGVARFELESAQMAGIGIPKAILQRVVSYYSRTSDYPHGISLDDPFPLPAGIRQIEMHRGEATVVQQ
jgi:hypothetical protein